MITTTGRPRIDAVTYLTAFLVLLLAMEQRYVIGPLGGAGTPAQMVALGALGWWIYYQLQGSGTDPAEPGPVRWHPVRGALALFALAFLASYAVAMSRPIDGAESSTATLGMISLAGWLGIALLAHDGISDLDRLDRLIYRIIVATALLALLGIAQFALRDHLISGLSIPGLQEHFPPGGLSIRSGFVRPAGTTLHPIEFGAVLSAVLPLAIGRVRTGPASTRTQDVIFLAAIGIGIVVCGSRSALLCALVAVAVLVASWSLAARITAAVVTLLMGAVVALTVPGMMGSLLGLFTGISDDGSVRSRTDSYPIAGAFFELSPWLGRGFSTFLPSYRILDNQYLLLLIEVGLVGLIAFLILLVAGIGAALGSRRLAPTPRMKDQCQGLAAGIAATAVGLATYDGLSFPTATGVLFLLVGLAGASWRLMRESPDPPVPAPRRSETGPVPVSTRTYAKRQESR